MDKRIGSAAAVVLAALGVGHVFADDAQGPGLNKRRDQRTPSSQAWLEYAQTIRNTANMVGDTAAKRLAGQHKLDILKLTWEDTGRFKGSSVGPNISDMTIQVGLEDRESRQFQVTCMPVIRYPNFSDKTCDIDPREFTVLVGNERGGRLRRVSLYDFLASPTSFLSKPQSWRGKNKTLLAPERDSKVLVSAQACFLPIPKQGVATFNPVLFNYQSVSGDPAVLTLLATREGTSTTVIDNKRDAFRSGAVWGQRLFHNQGGERASLTGTRYSDSGLTQEPGSGSGAQISGMNMVLLVQVPLKQKNPRRGSVMAPMWSAPAESTKAERSNVENAVIGHGEIEGPFTEIDDLVIERDPRFPVRVTVQFYKATSNGVISEADMRAIKREIDSVYEQSDAVGSLVTGGHTGRVTEYWGSKVQPANWWNEFWRRHEENTGDTRAEAIAKLRKLLGDDYQSRPVSELYLKDLLRSR